jgi:hypothetical protein
MDNQWHVNQLVRMRTDVRFRGEIREVRGRCPHHANCTYLQVAWHAGNLQTIHSVDVTPVDSGQMAQKPELVRFMRLVAQMLKNLETGRVSAQEAEDQISVIVDEHRETARPDLVSVSPEELETLLALRSGRAYVLPSSHKPPTPREVFQPEDLIEYRAVDSDPWIQGIFVEYVENDSDQCIVRLWGNGHVGRKSRTATKYLRHLVPVKLDNAPDRDAAYELHVEAQSRPRSSWWRILDILAEQPYLVIGDFAYLLGADGDFYQVPVKFVSAPTSDNPDRSVFTPQWREAVEIDVTDADWVGRLGNVISDMENISDIMRQSGVEVKTPKEHEFANYDENAETDNEVKRCDGCGADLRNTTYNCYNQEHLDALRSR